MQSKRRRAAGRREESAAELLAAYREKRTVSRAGGHAMLRWLTIARSYADLPPSESDCPMDAANGNPTLIGLDACRALEKRVAARVMGDVERHEWYLEYAAAFFRWWYRVCEVTATPRLPMPEPEPCTWLLQKDIEKSLVVPDVRRGAVKLAQTLQVRAGEHEVASSQAGGRTRSVSAVLQALRTGEWNVGMHKTLMYGPLLEIYHAGLLDAIQLAIVDARYQGRLSFSWATHVLRTPSSTCTALGAWPLVFCHGTEYVVLCHDGHVRCSAFAVAYAVWRDICMAKGGLLAGRYDVSKCTI